MEGGIMTVEFELDTILHQRIIDKCMSLYKDGHFSHAAFESMKQVELALKEKSGPDETLYGTRLVDKLLGPGKSIKLTIPLGEDLQKQANSLFKGAFSYYRNYAAHDGSRINKVICIRIMVLASELLDLIAASPISFTEIGGVEGLIKHGIFADESRITGLLSLLLSEHCPDDCFDGLFEDLAYKGYTDNQYQSVFDLGLIVYKEKDCGVVNDPLDAETIGWFELTPIGQKVFNKNQNI
jgi:uncharacterized protein (TIGR02391 family)